MRQKRVRISVSLTEEDQKKLEFVKRALGKKTKSGAVRSAIDFVFYGHQFYFKKENPKP